MGKAVLAWRSHGVAALSVAVLAFAPRLAHAEDRAHDGTGNNLTNPSWGAAGTALLRRSTVEYADSIDAPSGPDRPNARGVSVICGQQSDNVRSDVGLSNLHTVWGQFLDHDITLTPDGSGEPLFVDVPVGDPWFDPLSGGGAALPFMRSSYDPDTGTSSKDPRQQINAITAYIDGSMIYGSSAEVASLLRRNDSTGMLLTSPGDLLPYNDIGLGMANPMGLPTDALFAAGDIRANENCQLTAMHTMMVREHNRLCVEIAAAHPDWSGDEIYQRARKLVGAFIQRITFAEYLPTLLGPGALPPYTAYDPEVDAGIAGCFQVVAFRLGHSQVNEVMLRVDSAGAVASEGNISMRDAFFAPDRFVEVGVGSWLHGASLMISQRIDMQIASSLRNFMFGPPGAGGLDLFALNCQRSRDHGLPDYNQLRLDYGLTMMGSMDQITTDTAAQADLMAAYTGRMQEIDPWVGGLAEDHLPGTAVGELFHAILVDQFTRLRDGDRFWYENDDALTAADRTMIESTTLADIIRRNTSAASVPDMVLLAPDGVMPLLADLTMDGIVAFDDLLIVLDSWGPIGMPGQHPLADIDGDAVVGFGDLVYVLSWWGAH